MPISLSPMGSELTAEQKATLLYFKYNLETDKLIADKSVETILASIYLGDAHKITSGAENSFTKNLSSGINYHPVWAGIKDHANPVNRDISGIILPSIREYTPNMGYVEASGPVGDLPAIPYSGTATFPYNVSIQGVQFKVAQTLIPGNVLHYALYLGTDNTGIKIFGISKKITSTYVSGDLIDFWYDSPAEVFSGVNLYAELEVETEQNSNIITGLMVYPALSNPNTRYSKVYLREFLDIGIVPFTPELKDKLDGIAANADVSPTAESIKVLYESLPNTNEFSDDLLAKLSNISGGSYLGVYPTAADLAIAYPTGVSGDSATVTQPVSTLYYWSGSAWVDSGTGSTGDMLKSVYDPGNKATDAFSIGNMNETAAKKVFTSEERTKLANQSGVNTGDEPTFQGSNQVEGVVPVDGVAPSGRFLRDDGTWANVPPPVTVYRTSVEFIRRGDVYTNVFLKLGEFECTLTRGWIAPDAMKLIGVTIGRSDTSPTSMGVYVDGVLAATVTSTTTKTVESNLLVNIAKGSIVSVKNSSTGSSATDVVVSLWLEGQTA